MKKIKFRADRDMTVEKLLEENNVSHKLIKSLKAKGLIQKDGKPLYLSKIVKEGDFVTLFVEEERSDIKPIEMPLDIVYEDNDMIVLNKPYGLSVMSTANMQEIALINGLQDYFIKNNIDSKVHVVNRLDRNTTGLMVVSKNRLSCSLLCDSLKNTLKRRYYALIKGHLDKKEDIIYNKIAKEGNNTVRRVVRNDGKDAITTYKVIDEYKDSSLLDIELLTGRTHQIRVTFTDLYHPLLGDKFYNRKSEFDELMLHSFYLEFVHPITKEKMVFTTEVPERFKPFMVK